VRTNVGVTRVRRLARATPAEIWTSDASPGQAADLIADELLVAAGLWHAVPSFPTISEVWLRLLETYGL
jgi:hypothetical protein